MLLNKKWGIGERRHMKYAEKLANQSDCTNRHGCVIYKKNQLIGKGCNKDKTHPAAIYYYSGNIHAEFAAMITTNKKYLPGSSIFVVRIMRSKGEPLGISKPCKICMKMIRKAKIKKVYYTIEDGSWRMDRV